MVITNFQSHPLVVETTHPLTLSRLEFLRTLNPLNLVTHLYVMLQVAETWKCLFAKLALVGSVAATFNPLSCQLIKLGCCSSGSPTCGGSHFGFLIDFAQLVGYFQRLLMMVMMMMVMMEVWQTFWLGQILAISTTIDLALSRMILLTGGGWSSDQVVWIGRHGAVRNARRITGRRVGAVHIWKEKMKTRISTKKIGSVSLRCKTSYIGSVSKNMKILW